MRIILGLLVILLGLLAGYSASRYKAPEIQADIDGRTEERLVSIETAGGLTADTDGRHVTLRGYAGSDAEKEQVIQSAEKVWGALGPIDEIELLKAVTPYAFSIAKEESGRTILQGVVPSEVVRLQLIAKSEEMFGDEVESKLTLAAGVPDGDWVGAVSQGMDGLAALNHGQLGVVDNAIELTGKAPRSEDVDRIAALKAEIPEGFTWASRLDVERPTASPFILAIGKADGAWQVEGHAPDEASRDALIEAVKQAAEGQEVDVKLQLAHGAPGADWQGFVLDRLPALHSVKAGMLRFEDYDVRLGGTVASLGDSEEVITAIASIDPKIRTEIEALDPTRDAFLDLRLSPDDGVTVNGALPPGLPKAEAVELLGLDAGHDDNLSENGRGDVEAWRRDLQTIGSYLPEFETVELSLKGGRAAIDGETYAKNDAEQVIEKLSGALDERKAKALADLRSYQEQINLARSKLSGRTATLDAREREIEKANERLAARKIEVETAKADIDRLDLAIAKRGDAEGELAMVEGKITELQREQATKLAILGMLAGKIERQRGLAEQDQQGLMSLRSGVEITEARLGERQAEIDQAEERLTLLQQEFEASGANLDQRRAEAKKDVAALHTESETMAATLEERRGELEQVENSLASLRNERSEVQALLAGLAQDRDDEAAARGDLEGFQKELKNVSATLEEREADLAATDDRLAESRAILKQMEDTLSEKMGETTALEQQIETGEQRLAEILSSATNFNRQAEEAQQNLAADNRQIADLQEQIAALKYDEDKVRIMVAGLRAHHAEQKQIKIDLDGLRTEAETAGQDRDEQVRLLTEERRRVEEVGAQLAELENKRNTLEQQVQTVNAELDDKEARAAKLSDVEARLAEKEVELSNLNQEQVTKLGLLGSLGAKLEKQRGLGEEYAEAEARFAALMPKVEAASGDLADRHVAIEKAEQRLAFLGGDIESAENRLKMLEVHAEKAVLAEQDRKASMTEAEERLALLQTRIENVGEDEAAKATRLAALAAEVAESEGAMKSLRLQRASLESENATLSSSIDKMESEAEAKLARLDEAFIEKTSAFEQRQASLSAAEEQLAALQAKFETVGNTEAEKTKRLAAVRTQLANAEKALEELQSRKVSFEAEVTGLAGTLKEREMALASAKEAKARVDIDLKALEAKLASAEAGLAARIDEQSKAAEEKKQAEAELQRMRADIEKMRVANAEAAGEAETIEASLGKLVADIDVKQAEEQEATSALQALKAETEQVETALTDGQAALDRLVDERRKLRDAIDQARDDISAAKMTTAAGLDPLLAASPVQTDDGVRIAHLLFNHSSSQLSPGAQRKVEEAAAWIKGNEVETIRLIGYADATGSSASNQALSQARAERIASELADLGIDFAAIEVEAVGDSVLVEATGNQVAEPLNRSVGIFVGE